MKIGIATMCFAGLLALHHHASGAPTAEEVEAAKRTQALAEAAKATAEANRAVAEADAAAARARLGTLDVSKLAPPVAEAKTLSIEGNLLAYAAMQNLAKKLAAAINVSVNNRVLLIYSEKEIKELAALQSFTSNLASLDKDIGGLAIPMLEMDNPQCAANADRETGGGGLGVLGFVDVASQVASLFKTNRTMEGSTVTLDEFALSAAVMAQLKELKVTAIYPPLFFNGNLLKRPVASQVERNIDSLASRASRIDTVLAAISRRKEDIKERSKPAKKPNAACRIAFAAGAASLDAVEARAQALKSRAAKYIAVATTPDEKTGDTLLQSLAAAEALQKAAAGGVLLQLKPIAAGGTTMTKTSFFSSSFRFSGGAVVAYMLVDGNNGAIMASGLVGEYGGNAALEDLGTALKSKSN